MSEREERRPFGPGDEISPEAVGNREGERPLFLAIDLSAGPSSSSCPLVAIGAVPAGGWDDSFRRELLVLRRVDAGTFQMGSPSGELGRGYDEKLHEVTLTRGFYIGVFAVTQRQWELVMGENPSGIQGDRFPVERVSYDMIRGWTGDSSWPRSAAVAPGSFLGRLRARTGLGSLDLPTEAQWEYACRAGTTTALNSGEELTELKRPCPNLGEVGWYAGNRGEGTHRVVGLSKPNAWGLYDMHGNVSEWCLDRYGDYRGGHVTDPVGASAGSGRILRGGGWRSEARACRSAHRDADGPSDVYGDTGFRLALTLPG